MGRLKLIFGRPWWGACAGLLLLLAGCGEKEVAYDTNLLKNPSFEKVGSDGIPEHWELVSYRGLPDQVAVEYGIDDEVAQDGERSWYFDADVGTRRFYMLTQEVEVKDATHVNLKGWIQTDQVEYHPTQYGNCNLVLTFYDQDHARFQSIRPADRGTKSRKGTVLWTEEDSEFRVPQGTRYIGVSCVLGMDGRAWFDNISLVVPRPLEWESTQTKNFNYHWLPGHPPPDGAIDNQQSIFNDFARRLGVPDSDVFINYYFYPDTTTIRTTLGIQGHQYVSWDDREFHSINANDNHEVIHFITDPFGAPPKAIAEGTVFWLWGEWEGRPIRALAAYLLANDLLAPLSDLTTYNNFAMLDPRVSVPTGAAFVDYLVTRYGTEKLLELFGQINGVNSYGPFARALESVYGEPAGKIEQEYHLALQQVDYSIIEKMGLPQVGQ